MVSETGTVTMPKLSVVELDCYVGVVCQWISDCPRWDRRGKESFPVNSVVAPNYHYSATLKAHIVHVVHVDGHVQGFGYVNVWFCH